MLRRITLLHVLEISEGVEGYSPEHSLNNVVGFDGHVIQTMLRRITLLHVLEISEGVVLHRIGLNHVSRRSRREICEVGQIAYGAVGTTAGKWFRSRGC